MVVAAAGGLEHHGIFGRERFGPFGDGVAGIGNALHRAGWKVAEIGELARTIAADDWLWRGEGSCPRRAGSKVPSNCSGLSAGEWDLCS